MNEYILVDCDTELIYGPYESFTHARCCADELKLKNWEIINQDDNVVDWSTSQRRS